MKHSLIKVFFYLLPSKLNKERKEAPIYIRIKQNAQSINLTTGIWLSPNEWIPKKNRAKGTSYQIAHINNQLAEMEERVFAICHDLKHEEVTVTLETIKQRFKGASDSNSLLTLYEYRNREIQSHVNNGYSNSTKKHYKVTKKKVIEFLKQAPYKCSDISLDRLDFDFITRFDSFLASHYKNSPKTVQNNIKRLKAVVNTGLKLGWLKADPFKGYKSKAEASTREFLTLDEVTRIENLELKGNERLQITKDMYLFMVYTGISYSDLRDLSLSNINISITGHTFLNFYRNKTSIACNVPLFGKAKDIIETYKTHPICLHRSTLLPVISNQKLNKYLKEIASEAKITKPVTCHTARHTFATLSLNKNVPIETLSKVLGHTSIKTTQIYGKITGAKIEQDYAGMNTLFSNNTSEKISSQKAS